MGDSNDPVSHEGLTTDTEKEAMNLYSRGADPSAPESYSHPEVAGRLLIIYLVPT